MNKVLFYLILVIVIDFDRSQLCPQEAFGILYYLRTHFASHHFVNYLATASQKSLINNV